MTDNDIIKAMECCCDDDTSCADCLLYEPDECLSILRKQALNLINRQKAEIEALKFINSTYDVEAQAIRNIAIEEFALKLKVRSKKRTEYDEGGWDVDLFTVTEEDIDNLVKEMTEENDA